MPTVTIKIPRTSSFANRAKVRAGLGGLILRSGVALPGGNIFKGLGALFGRGEAPLPGPSVFPRSRGIGDLYSRGSAPLPGPNVFSQARGMGAFFVRTPRPVLPGPNIFQKYLGGKPFPRRGCPKSCSHCANTCGKRGMGDDSEDVYAAAADPSDPGYAQAQQILSALPTSGADLYNAPSDLGSSLVFSPSPAPATASTPLTSASSSNPSLDAYNQALTNALGNSAPLSTTALQTLSNAAAVATPTQLAQATTALTPTTSSLSTYLGSSTILTGYTNGEVLAGAGLLGVGVLAFVSARKKKGKR